MKPVKFLIRPHIMHNTLFDKYTVDSLFHVTLCGHLCYLSLGDTTRPRRCFSDNHCPQLFTCPIKHIHHKRLKSSHNSRIFFSLIIHTLWVLFSLVWLRPFNHTVRFRHQTKKRYSHLIPNIQFVFHQYIREGGRGGAAGECVCVWGGVGEGWGGWRGGGRGGGGGARERWVPQLGRFPQAGRFLQIDRFLSVQSHK